MARQTDVMLWLSQYNGSNGFVLSVRESARRYGSVTARQESWIRKFMAMTAEKVGASVGTSANLAPTTPASAREEAPRRIIRTYEELFGAEG